MEQYTAYRAPFCSIRLPRIFSSLCRHSRSRNWKRSLIWTRSRLFGNMNSNFGLGTDVTACNNLPESGGDSALFTSTGTDPLIGDLNNATPGATKITLKPGFISVSHFLICLRYVDRLLTDPKPMSVNLWDKYQYRVSYDYGDAVVTSRLENENTDSDAGWLFNQAPTLKRDTDIYPID